MLGEALVRPLEDAYRDVLDGVARARGWPASSDVARLGAAVSALSAAYNEAGVAAGSSALAARLGFSFPRDVPKGAAAVRELVAVGALAMPEGRPLRVLDIGAGLGATTLGVVRALEAAGGRGVVEATWVDEDAAALEVGQAIARAAPRGAIELRVQASPERRPHGARYDVVLLGQVLSEMDRTRDPAARIVRHAALLDELVGTLESGGSLVVLEPALRERSRHLHAVRDAVLALPGTKSLFAPCLHVAACPALAREGGERDWCHEDLPVDLPAWLVPVARAAGLRWQGLTFSYLVLRADGLTLRGATGASLRAVSGPIVTKGKREIFLCGGPQADAATRVCTRRLDRDRRPENEAWDELRRGDVVTIDPPPANGRVAREATVVLRAH